MTTDELAYLRQMRRDLLHARRDIAAIQSGADFMGQFGEDLLAWELLGKPRTGFFIEAGAFDGYRHSVTWALEQLGWTGLLVEPLPAQYATCVLKRPRSRVVRAMLGAEAEGCGALNVSDLDIMLSSADAAAAVQTTSQVTCSKTNLNTLLQAHQGPIDLVVLDVEGGELQALRGFDLPAFRPRIMLIEDNTYGKDPALRQYMSHFEYQFCGHLECNQIYVRKDEAEILERMKWMVN